MKSGNLNSQHGFMLLVACALSFTAFLFSVDFSALADEVSCIRPVKAAMAKVAIQGADGIPVRQQSTPAPQPMRAILVEAVAAKVKATYPDGNGSGLHAGPADLAFLDMEPAEWAGRLRPLGLSSRSDASARAPPRRV